MKIEVLFNHAPGRTTSKPISLAALGVPKKDLQIKSIGTAAKLLDHPIGNIVLLAVMIK